MGRSCVAQTALTTLVVQHLPFPFSLPREINCTMPRELCSSAQKFGDWECCLPALNEARHLESSLGLLGSMFLGLSNYHI